MAAGSALLHTSPERYARLAVHAYLQLEPLSTAHVCMERSHLLMDAPLHKCTVAQAVETGPQFVCRCNDSGAFVKHEQFCICAIQAAHGTACGQVFGCPL